MAIEPSRRPGAMADEPVCKRAQHMMPCPMEYEPVHITVDEPVMMCHQLGKVDLEAGLVHCQKQQYAGLVWTVSLVMLVAASVVAPMMEHWALALDAIALLFIVIASCMVLRGTEMSCDCCQLLACMPVTLVAALILLVRLTWLLDGRGGDQRNLDGLCISCSFAVASWSVLVNFLRAVSKGRQRLERDEDRKQWERARRAWLLGLGMLLASNCTSSQAKATAGSSVAFLLSAYSAYVVMQPIASSSDPAGETPRTESVSCLNILQLARFLPITIIAALTLVLRLSAYTMQTDVLTDGIISRVLSVPLVFWVLLIESCASSASQRQPAHDFMSASGPQ